MASTSDIRNGLTIEYNNVLYTVVGFQHVKPGKGPAFVRTKLKNVVTGKVIDNTFSAGHKIDVVRIESRDNQFLFKDEFYNFMDVTTFEQVSLNESMVEGNQFLKEGEVVTIQFHAELEQPLTCVLPQYVTLEITYTEPGIKGDTATNATKKATVETGAEINVPLFINEGEKVKVSTADGSYVERVK